MQHRPPSSSSITDQPLHSSGQVSSSHSILRSLTGDPLFLVTVSPDIHSLFADILEVPQPPLATTSPLTFPQSAFTFTTSGPPQRKLPAEFLVNSGFVLGPHHTVQNQPTPPSNTTQDPPQHTLPAEFLVNSGFVLGLQYDSQKQLPPTPLGNLQAYARPELGARIPHTSNADFTRSQLSRERDKFSPLRYPTHTDVLELQSTTPLSTPPEKLHQQNQRPTCKTSRKIHVTL